MNEFCEMKGIRREFSVARTPQQNGVAERKNRTLIKASRNMLADSKLPTTFWAEKDCLKLYKTIWKDAYSPYRMLTPVSATESSYENLGGSTPVNAANPSNADYPTDPLMSNLEDTVDL
ncbi:putative ribonuclease H-like domain-containing protein [Tanacetum coccineum]